MVLILLFFTLILLSWPMNFIRVILGKQLWQKINLQLKLCSFINRRFGNMQGLFGSSVAYKRYTNEDVIKMEGYGSWRATWFTNWTIHLFQQRIGVPGVFMVFECWTALIGGSTCPWYLKKMCAKYWYL